MIVIIKQDFYNKVRKYFEVLLFKEREAIMSSLIFIVASER